MLDEFKKSQEVAYSLLNNSIQNGKLSHAYLFDANNDEEAFAFILSFVQTIICPNHYTNFDCCNGCNICHRIQNNNYPEVKIIESDTLVIKKEQLLELQTEFSRSSIEGNYRVYIIKDCDKMNKQASNCLLKFLEEPVQGIIAILSCDSKTTIVNFMNDESKKNLINCVLSFLDYLEDNGLDTLIYMKKMWYNKVQNREDALSSFLLMIYFYYDTLKCKLGIEDYFFLDQIDLINKCAQMNSLENLIRKIEVVVYGYEMVRCNLNINLLMDDIVIRLGDTNECC